MKSFFNKKFNVTGVGLTAAGRVRDHNEDAFLCDNEMGVYLVADGLGGHNAGEVAAGICVDAVAAYFRANGKDNLEKAARGALESAHKDVYTAAKSDMSKTGMGCTAALLVFNADSFCAAWVGDSRVYLLRGGELLPVTRDHSKVQILVDSKIITPEQAFIHPERSIITRSIGRKERLEIDAVSAGLKENDVFLICSDGIHGMLRDADILKILLDENVPAAAVKKLAAAADRAGGEDNETAIIVTVSRG